MPQGSVDAGCPNRTPNDRDAAANRVVKRRIGQPPIVLAVQTDTMQLQLQDVVAVARGVEQQPGALVDLHQRCRFDVRG